MHMSPNASAHSPRAPPRPASWHGAATGLIDAIVGLLLAPVTPTHDDSKENP